MNVFDELFEMVFTDDYPEPIMGIMKGAMVETVPVKQAEFMLDNAQRFDAKFGAGAYRDVSARLQESVRVAMMVYMQEEIQADIIRQSWDELTLVRAIEE